MRILLARALLRLRGPIDFDVFIDEERATSGDIVLYRAHRRYVTTWELWRADGPCGDGRWELFITHYPWRRIDYVRQTLGVPDD